MAEWLSIDLSTLMRSVLPQLGLASAVPGMMQVFGDLAALQPMERRRGLARHVFTLLESHSRREDILERMATHRSDTIRELAATVHCVDPSLTLRERLELAARFAIDGNLNVREMAWMSFRPYLAGNIDKAVKLLGPWVRSRHDGLRRCAIEGTRPRGVWCAHLHELKEQPERAVVLLEAVKDDPSRYVQRAVGNWLNDASKTRPDWVRRICAQWQSASASPHTAAICVRGLRSLKRL